MCCPFEGKSGTIGARRGNAQRHSCGNLQRVVNLFISLPPREREGIFSAVLGEFEL
jgi:hypothetical protein